MKRMKMSLATIEGKLSRTEMKNIMAGSGGAGTCGTKCDQTCKGADGTTCAGVEGTCNKTSSSPCQCIVVC